MFYRKDIGAKALRRPATVIPTKARAFALVLVFAIIGTLLVYPWSELLPEKYFNWEQITIIRVAVLLFALLRMALSASRKKLTYRLYSTTFITFLFIWLFSGFMLKPYGMEKVDVRNSAQTTVPAEKTK